jgi:hypothetical protein
VHPCFHPTVEEANLATTYLSLRQHYQSTGKMGAFNTWRVGFVTAGSEASVVSIARILSAGGAQVQFEYSKWRSKAHVCFLVIFGRLKVMVGIYAYLLDRGYQYQVHESS